MPKGVTLVLDSNLVLNGNKKESSLVSVNGGSLTMKTGVTLRGAADGGVYVDGGSFTMSGGTISGNTESIGGGGVYVFSGSFTMSGGTISGNTASTFGGGVYVSSSGRFVKRGGGTIDATNTAGKGKVIGGARTRNSAAGPGDNLDSYVSGRAGGWE